MGYYALFKCDNCNQHLNYLSEVEIDSPKIYSYSVKFKICKYFKIIIYNNDRIISSKYFKNMSNVVKNDKVEKCFYVNTSNDLLVQCENAVYRYNLSNNVLYFFNLSGSGRIKKILFYDELDNNGFFAIDDKFCFSNFECSVFNQNQFYLLPNTIKTYNHYCISYTENDQEMNLAFLKPILRLIKTFVNEEIDIEKIMKFFDYPYNDFIKNEEKVTVHFSDKDIVCAKSSFSNLNSIFIETQEGNENKNEYYFPTLESKWMYSFKILDFCDCRNSMSYFSGVNRYMRLIYKFIGAFSVT